MFDPAYTIVTDVKGGIAIGFVTVIPVAVTVTPKYAPVEFRSVQNAPVSEIVPEDGKVNALNAELVM